MIAYRTELWCTGCGCHYGKGIPHDDPAMLPTLANNLVEVAKEDGWTFELAPRTAHWCPACTRTRVPVPVEKPERSTEELYGAGI